MKAVFAAPGSRLKRASSLDGLGFRAIYEQPQGQSVLGHDQQPHFGLDASQAAAILRVLATVFLPVAEPAFDHLAAKPPTSLASGRVHLPLLCLQHRLVALTRYRSTFRVDTQATVRQRTDAAVVDGLFVTKLTHTASVGARGLNFANQLHRVTARTSQLTGRLVERKITRGSLARTASRFASWLIRVVLNRGVQVNVQSLAIFQIKNAAVPRISMHCS